MQENQSPSIAEITIERLGGLGDGIGMLADVPVYVPFTLPGDRVRVRLLQQKADHTTAQLLQVLSPSPKRGIPPCRHYADCGGCQLQHLQEKDYLAFKTSRLADAVKLAGYTATAVRPIIHFPPAARRRVTFQVQDGKLGFFAPGSHRLVEISECWVMAPPLAALLGPLRTLLERLPEGKSIRSISLTLAGKGVAMEVKATTPLGEKAALEDFIRSHGLTRIAWEANGGSLSLPPQASLMVRLGGVDVPLPDGAFLQATEAAEEAITRLVLKALAGCREVVEFFCGLGTYTLPLAAAGTNVEALEGSSVMVKVLGKTAKAAKLPIRAAVQDLMKNPIPASTLNRFDAALINPPRTGAIQQVKEIAGSAIPKVVMVSCNPATFARDAKALRLAGFRLSDAIPIDQFQWTPHLETVAIFER